MRTVRVNQLGYLLGGPKRATWVSTATGATPFAVLDASGTEVFVGRSRPWPVRPDPSSGETVHVLDFSTLEAAGDGYVIMVAGERSRSFAVRDGLYAGLARDALEVFHLLRSGHPIEEARAPGYGRPAGHPGDVAVPAWSGPEAERLYPGWVCPGLFDVSGGWYDAGDYGKYATSGSIAVWQLLSTPALLSPGSDLADRVIEECRWQLDWLLRMQVPPGSPLAGTVFHRIHGTTWSPLPGWAHDDPTTRVLHRPSVTATLHLAAVAARAARLLRHRDPAYAARLLNAARVAYEAAVAHPDLIAPDDEGAFGGGPYGDPDPSDDLYWAAVELWLTTGEEGFLASVQRSPWSRRDPFDSTGFDFDAVAAPARLDLAEVDTEARASVITAARRLVDLQSAQPWGQPYAPAEWAWGSNGRILNNLVVLVTAARLSGEQVFAAAVVQGMDYLLGRNALARSYVVGYGPDAVSHPRTRQFGHDLDPAMPPAPRGAVVGGANSSESPGFPSDPRLAGLPAQRRHLDEPTSETTNDICIRWNAPLVYVAAFLRRY